MHDCHVSQQTIVTKLAGKLRDSLNHGYAYAFNRIPDVNQAEKIRCGDSDAKLVSDVWSVS